MIMNLLADLSQTLPEIGSLGDSSPISNVSTNILNTGDNAAQFSSVFSPILPNLVDAFNSTQTIGNIATVRPLNTNVNTASLWDIFKGAASKVITAGGNLLTAQLNKKAANTAPVTYTAAGQPNVTPIGLQADGTLKGLLQSLFSPAIQSGVSSGIQSSISKPPIWIWLVLGAVLLVVILRRR